MTTTLTRTLAGAGRVAQLGQDMDQKWKQQNHLRRLEDAYRPNSAQNPFNNRFTFDGVHNIELLACGGVGAAIGPDDSIPKIVNYHLDKMKQVNESVKRVTTAAAEEQRKQQKRPKTRKNRPPLTSSASSSSLRQKERLAREETEVKQAARILSASRQVRSAQKDIHKFMNRGPPPRMIIKRGQNIDGIGFESDLNYFSVCGLGQANDNTVKVFARESQKLFVTSSRCSKVIAQQAAANTNKSSRVLVGRNGYVRSSSAYGQPYEFRRGSTDAREGKTKDIDTFSKLSDTDYAKEVPTEIPLSWQDQLSKQNVVIKEAKPMPEKHAQSSENEGENQDPKCHELKFRTFLEEENLDMLKQNFRLQNVNAAAFFYANDYTPSESDRFSQLDSKYDYNLPGYNENINPNQNRNLYTTEQLVEIASRRNRESFKTRQGAKSAHARLNSSPEPSEELNIPKMEIKFDKSSASEPDYAMMRGDYVSKKTVMTSPITVTSQQRQEQPESTSKERLRRAQTAKPYVNWYPTTLDVYQQATRQAERTVESEEVRFNERLKNRRPITSATRRQSLAVILRREPMPTSREYTPIVFPINYKVAQKSLAADENQVINVIIDSNEPNEPFNSSAIGAQLTANPRELSSALSNRPKSGSLFPVVRPISRGSDASLNKRMIGSTQMDRMPNETSEAEKWDSAGSLNRIPNGARATSRTGLGSREVLDSGLDQSGDVLKYTEGIRVQIASKPAVTNPPPAPTPEPSDFVAQGMSNSASSSPRRKPMKKVRINGL
ncbi:uncharacterized protein LOC142356097 isoform X2 [Convolutriloba macropyga]|uniref:uncharacterized protein LOC142356097 isoform X2 n=1 Tax=Convolutriloba macropyga TaxID=536237 RepID=UPI003F52535F